jgi:hypothetical protein
MLDLAGAVAQSVRDALAAGAGWRAVADVVAGTLAGEASADRVLPDDRDAVGDVLVRAGARLLRCGHSAEYTGLRMKATTGEVLG